MPFEQQYADNFSQATVQAFINVTTQATQNCRTTVDQNQIVRIIAGDGSTVNVDLTGKQVVNVDIDCISNSSTQNSIDESITQAVTQMAQAVTQDLSADVGSSQTTLNVTNDLVQLGTTVSTEYTQNCVAEISQDQQFTAILGNNSKLNVTIDWEQTAADVAKCIQNTSTTNDLQVALEQTISQSAIAMVEDNLTLVALIVGVVIVTGGAVSYQGVKSLLDWRVLTVIFIFITGLLIFAFLNGIWPFRPTPPPSTNGNK